MGGRRRAGRGTRIGLDSVLWFVLPVVAAAFVFFGVQQATQARGTRGTFVATERDCDRGTCVFYGTFTADDGSIEHDRVRLDSPRRDFGVGDATTVYYTGRRGLRGVYQYRRGARDWLLVGGLITAGFAFLVVWGVRVRRRLRSRRIA